jgi:hypothetical protein
LFFFSFTDKVRSKETLIFVPQYQYGSNIQNIFIQISDGKWTFNSKKQTIIWEHDETENIHEIEIRPKKI